MLYIKQDDYDKFKCIAAKCKESCCKCWQIEIDDDALERYEGARGEFAKRLKQGIDFERGVFKQQDGNCSMLDEKGLCSLQCTMGEEALCYTCRLYPRHIEEFEDVREFTLSLSCPEAARMAVERIETMSFIEEEDDNPDDFEEFDYAMYTKLVEARKIILQIAQDRNIPLINRLESILGFGRMLQKYHNGEGIAESDEVINIEVARNSNEKINNEFQILYSLEILQKNWFEILDGVKKEDISKARKREQIALEQILVLLLFTYFCGAVYDDEIYSKVAFCVYSVVWIYEIYRSITKEENLEKLIEAMYIYAREVEHSDLNLNALEEYFQNS